MPPFLKMALRFREAQSNLAKVIKIKKNFRFESRTHYCTIGIVML